MKYLLSIMLLLCLNITAQADSLSSLTLTDAEMQKLKKYFPDEDTNRLTWQGDPLTVALPINKEKRLIFPNSISVDVKGALASDQLRILNNDHSLYLTALKSFSTTRIYVTLKDNGEVVMLDLSPSETASSSTQQIDIKQKNSAATDKSVTTSISQSAISLTSDSNANENVGFVELIRFAWQQLYAPDRLMQKSNFSRAPMHTEKFVSDLIYGDKVIAYPQGSWISDNHYVTAVYLRNKYQHQTYINLQKDLCGDWQATAIYPTTYLAAYGDKRGDSTMLFLVSNRPFGDSMGVCHGHA